MENTYKLPIKQCTNDLNELKAYYNSLKDKDEKELVGVLVKGTEARIKRISDSLKVISKK